MGLEKHAKYLILSSLAIFTIPSPQNYGLPLIKFPFTIFFYLFQFTKPAHQ